MATNSNQSTYDAAQIQMLRGLEAVRENMGMYLGGQDTSALHHLVYEVVDNSVDEALAGFCDTIIVEMRTDGSIAVVDNGRGIPTDIHPVEGRSALEIVLTELHAGGKFKGSQGYKVSGGLHGVGVSAVNAVSEFLRAEVKRDGKLWAQDFRLGMPQAPVKAVGDAEGTGTTIIFKPDAQLFTTVDFNYRTLANRLRDMAYLNKSLRFKLVDYNHDREVTYYFDGGIVSFVRHLTREKGPVLAQPFYVEKPYENVNVEIAMQYTGDFNENLLAFTNNIANPDGGTHVTGFRAALTRTINAYGRNKGLLKEGDALSGEDVREGLTAIISIKLFRPQFESQTKSKLATPEAKTAVETVLNEALSAFLDENPNEARRIIEKSLLASRARDAARKARDLVQRKGALEGFALPGKLADCSDKEPAHCEIFIVEGDSAGGCFSGDTLVALADGRNLSFKDIVAEQAQGIEHFCYTIRKDGKIGLERIINPRITKSNAQVINVHLDNGDVITCTPDHRFMLRDGSYKSASQLAPTDSLMPLYRKLSNTQESGITINGYEMVLDPASNTWLFTHVLADWYNRWNNTYSKDSGNHCHHIDFNKSNNNPTNILRLPADAHLALHRKHVRMTLHRPEVIEKGRIIKRSPEFRRAMSQRMRQAQTRHILSLQAKEQWNNPEYKQYMGQKWREFYDNNEEYREINRSQLLKAQQQYWSLDENRDRQSARVRDFFENNPQARLELSQQAKQQWQDQSLLEWRRKKTSEQWTDEYRSKRKNTLHQTYYNKTIAVLKNFEQADGSINLDGYYQYRCEKRDKSVLRFDTFCNRYFNGNVTEAIAAISNYNHKIIKIEAVDQLIDVYDIEVPHTHNFALASGIFVHNSAKQGRDRRFQAILPLRGKILNVEKSRLDKMLANNEVRALITALGTGIGETFDISRLRYHRILIMSVAGDEPTLIRNAQGHTEFVRIGEFIDQCIAGQRSASEYEVISFDQKRHVARFRPLKAVMRHANHEPMYKLTTRYGRSVKVTASHSVFVLENGQPVLKKGDQIRLGDQLVASRRIPRPASQPREIDLMKLFAEAGLIDNLYLRGESVRTIAAQRVLNNVSQPEQWNEARINLHTAAWERLVEYRQANGLSQKAVALRLGVKQAITISQWERGMLRPIQSQFDDYLATIGWEEPISYELVPSKIERLLLQDDSSANVRWREVSNYKAFDSFSNDELDLLDREVELVPQAHDDRAFPRMLSITPELLWFLGWFTAEGSLSKHQVSLSLGQKDAAFFDELKTTIEQLFGETPRFYQSPDNGGIKCYFNSVLAARLIRALGLGAVAHQKRVPNILFSLSNDLQRSYLEGYFLGDGTLSDSTISMTTNSTELKDGLLYLLGQLGIFAGVSNIKPNLPADAPIQTVHDYYNIAISGKQQLEQLRGVWQRHHLAAKVEAHLAKPATKAQAFTPLSDDMVGLEVLAVEELAPTGEFVYDFSVEEDENFLCGTGGLYAHNTDADVDGSHIRTLLLTFFFRHMRDLITNGHLYVAQPPLFRVQHGKAYKYVYDEATRDDYIRSLPAGTKVTVQRFKGLGEMNPDQLWDTTLNPGNRMILQVTIEDAMEADETFSMLMGEIVLPRKRFIQTHAADVKNLDV